MFSSNKWLILVPKSTESYIFQSPSIFVYFFLSIPKKYISAKFSLKNYKRKTPPCFLWHKGLPGKHCRWSRPAETGRERDGVSSWLERLQNSRVSRDPEKSVPSSVSRNDSPLPINLGHDRANSSCWKYWEGFLRVNTWKYLSLLTHLLLGLVLNLEVILPSFLPNCSPIQGYLTFDKNSGDHFGYINWKGGPYSLLTPSKHPTMPRPAAPQRICRGEKLQQGKGEGTIPCILLSVLVGGR